MNIDAILADIRRALIAAWSDVETGGVWLDDQSATSPYELKDLPFAVVTVDELTVQQDGAVPIAYPLFLIPVRATYVGVCDGSAIALRGKAMDLVTELYTDPFTTCQFKGVTRIHWGPEIEANKQFLAKQMPQRAIAVEFTVEVA